MKSVNALLDRSPNPKASPPELDLGILNLRFVREQVLWGRKCLDTGWGQKFRGQQGQGQLVTRWHLPTAFSRFLQFQIPEIQSPSHGMSDLTHLRPC